MIGPHLGALCVLCGLLVTVYKRLPASPPLLLASSLTCYHSPHEGVFSLLPAAQTIVEIRHMMYNVRVHSEKAAEMVAR